MKKFRPKKQLGQSFLTYQPIAEQLVDALNLTPEDEVLEIGSGKGILTERLAQKAKQVYAVEIDKRLADILKEKFVGYKNIEIINQDILKYDLSRFKQLKILGNVPYSISSQILFLLLKYLWVWKMAVLTLQKEFAARILAKPGTKEYGAITVIFNLHTEVQKLFSIPPSFFKPKPKIFSTVILLKAREQPLFQIPDEEFFTKVVKAAFSQRRKTLLNNLNSSLGIDKNELQELGNTIGINMTRRAETLTLAEFVSLSEKLREI
ncbi:MAG: 16S rRNA (adenine(1518)-N(6)/adenine(1519)-N(6))-dimethyltransferase RsmA [candidate division WOR-3 bacterium]|nr:16S rRNA (adenine(1518)-N(6)/adenine(1519)-N(6))-dimethyltransferase RsmA [candidate division WOR-3 bacterium]MDH5682894.1 16S rRNA (adenine(1518)-N(6)/adenine(1519)-N(6))-dimethyltransferase RsmA [candidate division WOR-3 bacterium]